MRRFLRNDVTKVIATLALIFILAAALVPQLYNFGQFLGEVTEGKTVNPLVDSLGESARNAGYDRYFNRSLYLATLLLLPFVLPLLGNSQPGGRKRGPWSFALPPRAIAVRRGQPLEPSAGYYWEILSGFILASTLLVATGIFAVSMGFFVWAQELNLAKTVPMAFATGMGIALLEEIVFRGILLGIFLRTFRPVVAIISVAFIFALLHYLRPPAGVIPDHPETLAAGFQFLGLIVARLFTSELVAQQFITLFAAGLLLGACRYRTSSLWLPIGLHGGWLFALRLFENLTLASSETISWKNYLMGDRLSEGFLPLGTLGLTAIIVWIVYRDADEPQTEMNGDLNLPSPSRL